jgi:hypothetical protein
MTMEDKNIIDIIILYDTLWRQSVRGVLYKSATVIKDRTNYNFAIKNSVYSWAYRINKTH